MRGFGAKNGYIFLFLLLSLFVGLLLYFFFGEICCSFSFSGFKEYLESAPNYDFPSYRQLVHDITQKFNKISSDVITIETKFREAGYTSIAELIRKIQLKEKEKLELVSEQMKVKKKKVSSPVLLPKISLQLIWFVLVSIFSSNFLTVKSD